VCSGTPIVDTPYVVTAAHCVLDRSGNPGPRAVLDNGTRTWATAVLVDVRYQSEPSPRLDAAVLVMERPLRGPAARLGSTVPIDGVLTLAGYQPVDHDGALLRGTSPEDRPSPGGAAGGVLVIDSAPAGCDAPAASLYSSPGRAIVRCGLIPGASGGPLLARVGDELVLVGIVSTVTGDLSANGVVPLASLHRLLAHPDCYLYPLTARRANGRAPAVR
jgi:hypothetical protein